jgi:ribonuclease-3
MVWKFPFFKKKKRNPEIQAFVRKAFGFSPGDTGVYEQALRHSSAATRIKPGIKNSNERLEFLGDAILDSVVAHYLYNKYPLLPEGELTKMKSKVVRRENLNMVGYTLRLHELLHLNLGKQEMHDSIVGNALEAIIGAVYLDKGFNVTRDIVLKLLKQHGLDSKVHDDIDYKSKLHEWSQKNKINLSFKVIEHRNEGGSSFYRVAILVDSVESGIGEGNSKKAAEQKAAGIACERIFGRRQNA